MMSRLVRETKVIIISKLLLQCVPFFNNNALVHSKIVPKGFEKLHFIKNFKFLQKMDYSFVNRDTLIIGLKAVATFSCSIFLGAATYVNLVEVPAR